MSKDEPNWITRFCEASGHEYFCKVRKEFIEDENNLVGLSPIVNYYNEALDLILDIERDELKKEEKEIIQSSAILLYGLIHSRYINTTTGLREMASKYENGDFGTCPRFLCNNALVVPCGRRNRPERDVVKLFCPRCLDLYSPQNSFHEPIDGAFFGTNFAHVFFEAYPQYLNTRNINELYIPKVFGFRINEYSKNGSRAKWLRTFPG
ncbi:putative casein kinase II subunit beta-2 [Zancudomyces culisetae]|uniref:Casein kinase II subunit beta n=1 Tax=Zancudomyces culisetae TaxID=1213189 RepID=A0A1R1PPF7_ZANCU|nr:putative casein kinase II subunit beta-2 [Zancudomyces culisetae]OMH82847.1 putative casein kinase II subunit beta-2 [Zancudomyces culisetae]|eukprot:OMH82792.1 putative casein kinase II subunit beta-2 [Zancudomyces culisetae]